MDYSAGFIVIFALLGTLVASLILALTGFYETELERKYRGAVSRVTIGGVCFICVMIGLKIFGYS